jgi:hypothetical protein
MKARIFFLILFIFSATSFLNAQKNTEAVILYIEGTVDITRNGEYLDYSEVEIGTVIENYDMIETGADGYVEIEVNTPVSPAVTLKILEDTSFYYETKNIQGNNKTSFQLLTGSISMKVQKLYNDNELEVNVNSSVMGVRGTEFTISAMIDGSTLVTTKEGKVSCKNESGQETFSTPGVVCETDENNLYREVNVPVSELESYRNKWTESRLEILKSNALVSIRHYAKLYNQFYPPFDRSWQALERKDEIFQKWIQNKKSGSKPSIGDAVLNKQSVSREIIELRSVLPIFQHTFYVMRSLGQLYREGYGQGNLSINMTQKQLFNFYFDNYDETRRRLAKSMYYFRIYLDMGRIITGLDQNSESLLESITSGSNMLMGPPTPNSPF